MKKNFTRALSLLLVLVMILGAMPVALADDPTGGEPTTPEQLSINITANPTNPKAGEKVTFTATGIPAGAEVTWTGAQGSGATASVIPAQAGPLIVGVEAKVTEDGVVTAQGAADITVTVAEADIPADGIDIIGSNTMVVGGSQTLKVTALPTADAKLPGNVTWETTNANILSVNSTTGTVTALAKGTASITATCGTLTDTISISVGNAEATLVVTTGSLTLDPNESKSIQGDVTSGGKSLSQSYYSISLKSDNPAIAKIGGSGYTVTGVAAGETYVTVTAKLTNSAPSTMTFDNGKTSTSVVVPVTVNSKYYIGNVSNQSVMAGSTITLNPVLYNGKGERVQNATFTVSPSGCTLTNNGTTFYATSNTAGSASVTFTANNVDNGGTAVTKTVYLGFYRSNALKVSVRDNISSFRFYDKGVIMSAVGGNQNYTNLNNLTMVDLIGYAMPTTGTYNDVDYYSFGISGSNGGELLAPSSGSSLNWTGSTKYVDRNNLDAVGFQQKSSSNKTSNFTIYAMDGTQADGVIVGMLTLQINAGAASGGIEYSTNYNTPVTFKVADFQNYWNAHKNDQYGYGTNNNYYNTTETLSYVTFGITNTVPAYGTLYTTSAKTTKATAGMQFYAGTYSNNNSNYYSYALSSVTYVPSTSYTASYTVDIPFTAYGTSGTSVTGYVSIKMNDNGNKIGARGTTLDDSVAASIAANYYAAKGQNMGYVVFELPSAQQATLFRSIPKVDGYSRVTEAARVQRGDKFYYTGTYNSGYTYGSTYDQYVNNNNKVNCGCNNLTTCYNTWCKYYDGNSYNNNTIDCGCHNNYYCTNTWCKYYDGNSYTNTNTTYAANQLKLTDLSIVPAAGFKGKLTLTYTAYNAGGASAYTGYITYDVETQTASKVFSDVKGNYSWAADSADFLYYEGTAQGSNGKYNPSANITRGDFMLMLYRAFLEGDYSTTAVTDNFSDVTKGTSTYSQETYQAVGIAKKLGIAQGTNGKFNPKSYITREEAMVLIYRTLDEVNRDLRYSSNTNASSFSDYSKISAWATTAISNLVSHGVIQGSNNRITPKSNITRAEMACILHRVITY